jgi:hypothetical protein
VPENYILTLQSDQDQSQVDQIFENWIYAKILEIEIKDEEFCLAQRITGPFVNSNKKISLKLKYYII